MKIAMLKRDVALRRGRGGFSLIEILIATTILLVIVILASMVFQQTTGAYQTGERKVNAQVALRNVLGAITRDLALAVDSENYPGLENVNSWGGNAITFLALTGKPEKRNGTIVRTVQKITYSFSGGIVKRAQQYVSTNQDGTWHTAGNSIETDLNGADNKLRGLSFDAVGDGSLPDCVYVTAMMETKDKIWSVGVGSGGKKEGADDDIWVGYNPDKGN